MKMAAHDFNVIPEADSQKMGGVALPQFPLLTILRQIKG